MPGADLPFRGGGRLTAVHIPEVPTCNILTPLWVHLSYLSVRAHAIQFQDCNSFYTFPGWVRYPLCWETRTFPFYNSIYIGGVAVVAWHK